MSIRGEGDNTPHVSQSARSTAAQKYAREVGRFVSTIQVTRIILIALIALGAVFAALLAPELSIPALIYGAVSALVVYVLFGWLEHSLGLLSGIYLNGHPSPPTVDS